MTKTLSAPFFKTLAGPDRVARAYRTLYEGHFVTPPPLYGNPLLGLGRFEKSKGPSQEGLLDLGLFEIPKGPSQEGLLDLGLFEISNGPSQQGLLDLG